MESRVIVLSKDLEVVRDENAQLKAESKSCGAELAKHKEQSQLQSMQLGQLNDKIHVSGGFYYLCIET
jgi:hypothetical protein